LSGDQLARIATMFSVAEYFWLYLLGLSCPILVAGDSRLRAAFALLIGLGLSTVGLGAVHEEARFTFGSPQLYQGIGFIPAMIGLFGLSEVFSSLARLRTTDPAESRPVPVRQSGTFRERAFLHPLREILVPAMRRLSYRKSALVRSGTVGAAIGMLPGAGVDIAAWVSAALSNKRSKEETRFDQSLTPQDESDLNIISDASAANSSALAGCWIPSLVFGIPGDSITAIVIGVLLMKNIEPGPAIFEKQAPLVYGIYLLFILANFMLLPIGLLAIRLGGYIVHIPKNILIPIILLFCVIGAYAINGSMFDVWIMLVMGIVGFLFERRRIPLGPIVLGMILGGPLEERFVQTISGANGSLMGLVERPAAFTLGFITAAIWIWAALGQLQNWISANRRGS
ncbi:MAG TPA: tripartite tricarboxylate transporter permease, partial [Planctomicrobium sp.]|nr:tripartite tricarboxylate transporter permease [Planctomicrobium sp.]